MKLDVDERSLLLRIIHERTKESRETLLKQPQDITEANMYARNFRAIQELEILTAIKTKICEEASNGMA